MNRVVAILLAAGGSTRMGTPKGLLDTGGVPLVRRQFTALAAGGLQVVVVLGASEAAYREALAGTPARIVVNPDWASTGMVDSLRLGLAAAGVGAPGGPLAAIIQPVDVPPVRRATLAALLAVPGDAVPVHLGRPGHPVRLEGGPGPAGRLDHRLAAALRVAVDDADCLLNLNSPADWAAWRDRAVDDPDRVS